MPSSTNEALYLHSISLGPSPRGEASPEAEAARNGRAAAGPEYAGPGQEQRHEALGARSQGRGQPTRKRRHRVSSRASGWDLHRHSSAHRMAGPRRDNPMSCILGAGSRYWWWALALLNPLQSRGQWHL